MAVKTFAVGELVTATDANTYLANSGLVFVKQVTISGAVGGVNVTGAFSSQYDDYRIVVSGLDWSNASYAILFWLGTYGATGYYGNMTYYGLGTGQNFLPSNNTQSVYVGIQGGDNDSSMVIDIFNPNKAQSTTWTGNGWGWQIQHTFAGSVLNTTQYTSFQLAPGFGTVSAGTITVYGYRKA